MHKSFYLVLIFLLFLGDIFLFKESSDIRIFGLLLVYALFIKIHKPKSSTTLFFSLILLVLAYIQFIFSNTSYFLNPDTAAPTSERTAVWSFLVFVVGIIQQWKE